MLLVEWYAEDRTATMLAVSTRTVRRMAQDGTLRRAWRPLAGRKPEAVYHPGDVEREAAKARPRPMPVPDARDLETGPPTALTGRVAAAIEQMAAARLEPQIAGRMAEALARLASARQETPGLPGIPEALERMAELIRRAPRASPPLWMTLAEASEYSGLTQALLERLIEAGKLHAIRDRATKVKRAELDFLDPS